MSLLRFLLAWESRITAWRHRTADYSQFGRMMAQRVADIVQPDRMRQLGKKQAHYMTPWREGARLLVDSVLASKFLRQPGSTRAFNYILWDDIEV